MDQKDVRILVFGDISGQYSAFIKKLRLLEQKSGPFDVVFCVGDFFGLHDEQNREVLSGKVLFPLPVYILGPTIEANAKYFAGSQDFAENLTYLGKKGILTLASGLCVAYLSGLEAGKEGLCQFDSKTVSELITSATAPSDFRGVDILLTSVWPKGVDCFDSCPPASQTIKADFLTSPQVSRLAAVLRPRYHFAALNNVFYERQPYRNHRVLAEPVCQVTRFIGLARFGNAMKQRFMYAFGLVPMRAVTRSRLVEQPSNATEIPYGDVLKELVRSEQVAKRKRPDDVQFFYDTSTHAQEGADQVGSRRRKNRPGVADDRRSTTGNANTKQSAGRCWFCLSSPDVEKHLVVSVGEHTYLALAKGGLTTEHALILSINHVQSFVAASEEIRTEIARFKDAVRKCFADKGKSVVFFERNYRTQHLQIQAVPVSNGCRKNVKKAFLDAADISSILLAELPAEADVCELVNEGCPYFWAEVPTGEQLFFRITKGFPLQFGRQALASSTLLDVPDRVDWKACSLTKEEEASATAAYRKMFELFDFTDV